MFVAIQLIIQMYQNVHLIIVLTVWHFKFPKVVQAHTLGEVGIFGTVLLRVYSGSGTVLPIFIEIGSYKEQKISWHSFLWDTVYLYFMYTLE